MLRLVALLLSGLLIHLPCRARAQDERPDWISRGTARVSGPRGERLLQGVGVSQGIRNRGLAAAAAEDRARTELTGLLAAHMDPSLAKKKAAEAKVVEHWRDPSDKSVYALVRLSAAAAGLEDAGEWETAAEDPEKELAAFREKAGELRARAKEPQTEDGRRFRVQAENAVEEQRFEDAARRYRQAIDASPWWADGYFNLALVLGELERYPAAIAAMRKYLILAPEAADARAARDKIYVWEDQAGRPAAQPEPSPAPGRRGRF